MFLSENIIKTEKNAFNNLERKFNDLNLINENLKVNFQVMNEKLCEKVKENDFSLSEIETLKNEVINFIQFLLI